MSDFNKGDSVVVLGKINAVVQHVYKDDNAIKITLKEEKDGESYWTVVPSHWLELQ